MKHVLVVDNHPVILEYMRSLLADLDYEVHTAQSGLEALEILRDVDPSIIFVDLIMPNIDGKALCRLVRTMPALDDTYVVVLSAVAAEEQTDVAALGADACIAKAPFPIMSKHVLRCLEEAGRPRAQGRRAPVYGIEDVFRRQITEELLSSRHHLQTILENIRDGILEVTADGSIVYANPAALAMMGCTEMTALGRPFLDIIRPEEKGRLGTLLRKAQGSDAVIHDHTSAIVGDRQVALRLCPVGDTERHSVIVLMVDMEERAQLHTQLRRAFRMESVAALAGGIAHEFNNALCEISGITSLLEGEAGKLDESLVGPLRTTIHRMSELTDQLLAYSRRRAVQPTRFDVSRFLRLNLPVIAHSLSSGQPIRTNVPEGELYIHADGTQIQMALSAVITNASEAIGESGTITVGAALRSLSDAEAARMPDARAGRWAVVTVADDGCGMSPDVLRRIFEPFYSTKAIGRGLGMAAAHGIVESHGGWITVESEPARGTTVRIFLPPADKV